MSILKVGIEGLHRSGKGTQLSLLKKHLDNMLIDAVLIRGEYYRKGKGGGEFLDPYSAWRQSNRDDDTINFEKSQRLNREIRVLVEKKLIKASIDPFKQEAILFDRTILSRHFLDTLHHEFLPFAAVQYIRTKSGKTVEKVIPDIIFALKCKKETLLKRLDSDDLSQRDISYKQGFIEQHGDKFNQYLENSIPQELSRKTIIINGELSKECIHKEIVKHLHMCLNVTGSL